MNFIFSPVLTWTLPFSLGSYTIANSNHGKLSSSIDRKLSFTEQERETKLCRENILYFRSWDILNHSINFESCDVMMSIDTGRAQLSSEL